MSVSLGPFLTSFFTIIFLTGYLCYILHYNKNIISYGIRLIFLGIAFILLRTLIPINFPFTISIYFEKLLLPIHAFFNLKIGNTNFSIASAFLIIWFIGFCYKLFKLTWHYIQYPRYLKPFILKDRKENPLVDKVFQKHAPPSFRIAIIPMQCSPAIWGLHKPILILPDILLTEEELTYIVLHEVRHYTNYDLWLILLLNISLCFHWCNPFMYLLNKKLTLAFELSNDEVLLRDYTNEQKISYTECVLKISRLQNMEKQRINALSFTATKGSDLKHRINFLLSVNPSAKSRKIITPFVFHALLVGSVLLTSFIFVPEIDYLPKSVEESTLSITSDNAYLKEQNGKYLLFVNGQYITSFSSIPEEFETLKLK